MQFPMSALTGVVDVSDAKAVKDLFEDDAVVGYSLFDADGTPLQSRGVGDTAIEVFSRLYRKPGEAPRAPATLFSGREMELVALPLANADLLVLKAKPRG